MLSEIREYLHDENPLHVALWRDQMLTLAEHNASMDALMSHSMAEIRLRTALANLQAAQQAVRDAERALAENPPQVPGPGQHWRFIY